MSEEQPEEFPTHLPQIELDADHERRHITRNAKIVKRQRRMRWSLRAVILLSALAVVLAMSFSKLFGDASGIIVAVGLLTAFFSGGWLFLLGGFSPNTILLSQRERRLMDD